MNATSSLASQIFALIISATLVMGSPGPSTVSVTAMGAAFGWRRATPYVAGAIMGTIVALLAVASGVVALLMASAKIAPFLIVASAIYILYLAFRIATAPLLSSGGDIVAAPSFAGGFLLAVANPKAYFAIGAVFAQTHLPLSPPAFEAAVKIAALVAMIVAIHAVWLIVGAAFSRALRDPKASRIINILLALVLAATALLAFAT